MKFSCEQATFAGALQTVSKAISGNTTLPVLENILIKAEGSVVTLTATNLEITISTYFEASIEEEGAITLPAKILVSYINLLPQTLPVECKTTDRNVAIFSSGKGETKIKGISAEDFPIIPTVEATQTVNVDRGMFLEGLSRVIFSTSSNTTRPILSGVYLHIESGKIVMASTDSFRLSQSLIDHPGLEVDSEIQMIVPARTLTEVARIFQKDDATSGFIHLHLGSNQVLFESGETKLTSRLIEGAYPNYQQIIPKEHTTEIVIGVDGLLQNLKRMNLFAKENNFNVKFAVQPEKQELDVYTDSLEAGEDREVLGFEHGSGDELTIALNSTFVLDAIGHMNTDEIVMQFSGPLKPAVLKRRIKGVEDTNYLHLVMPLKA